MKNSTSWPCVAEILGHRQAGQRHAGARARRLVHLAVDEGRLRARPAAMLVDARFDHFMIEIVAFARAFSDAGEHRITAMRLGDIVDQLHDENGLAHAGAAEQADLAAFGIGCQQIDDLDSGDENFALRSIARQIPAPAGEWRAARGASSAPLDRPARR